MFFFCCFFFFFINIIERNLRRSWNSSQDFHSLVLREKEACGDVIFMKIPISTSRMTKWLPSNTSVYIWIYFARIPSTYSRENHISRVNTKVFGMSRPKFVGLRLMNWWIECARARSSSRARSMIVMCEWKFVFFLSWEFHSSTQSHANVRLVWQRHSSL